MNKTRTGTHSWAEDDGESLGLRDLYFHANTAFAASGSVQHTHPLFNLYAEPQHALLRERNSVETLFGVWQNIRLLPLVAPEAPLLHCGLHGIVHATSAALKILMRWLRYAVLSVSSCNHQTVLCLKSSDLIRRF
jgi:hypothetical protein